MGEVNCPSCGRELQYLEESKAWYCLSCDKKFVPSEDRSKLREIEVTKQVRNLTPDQEQKLVKQYEAVYIDGFLDMGMDTVTISVLTDSVSIFFDNYHYEMNLPYVSIELLNVAHEREITALRTFLIGPLFAAAFKKTTRILTIGWRDELNLLHLPSFKMAEDNDVYLCYATIYRRLKQIRGPSGRSITALYQDEGLKP